MTNATVERGRRTRHSKILITACAIAACIGLAAGPSWAKLQAEDAPGVIGMANRTHVAGEGPWTVTIDLRLESFGGRLQQLSIEENLAALFGSNEDWSLLSVQKRYGPPTFQVNENYDGISDVQLIDPAHAELGAGGFTAARAGIRLDVEVRKPGKFSERLRITARDRAGNSVSDIAGDGRDPDPDGDGDPTEARENRATEIQLGPEGTSHSSDKSSDDEDEEDESDDEEDEHGDDEEDEHGDDEEDEHGDDEGDEHGDDEEDDHGDDEEDEHGDDDEEDEHGDDEDDRPDECFDGVGDASTIVNIASSQLPETGRAFWIKCLDDRAGKNFGAHYRLINGQLVEREDGTAQLTGRLTRPGWGKWDLVAELTGRTTDPPPGSPKLPGGGGVDPSDWVYYTTFDGTLTGVPGTDYAGSVVTFVRRGEAFQIGDGANMKNLNFGASSWFTWELVSDADSGHLRDDARCDNPVGDINVDLDPLPPCDDRKGSPVGIAKRVTDLRQVGATSYEIDFELVVESFETDRDVTDVQVGDDLAATFPDAASIEIVGTPDIGNFSPPATPYDGVEQLELLSGTDDMTPGQVEIVTFTARVDLGGLTGTFLNQAAVTTSRDGVITGLDLSDDGSDPDPNDDGDPNSNPQACEADPNDPDCEDTPTPITISPQVVGVAKQAAEIRTVGLNRYEIDYLLTLENLGSVPATNVQVDEDLAAAFPGVVTLGLVGTPDIGALTPPAVAFDGVGNNLLLGGGDTLPAGAVATIFYTVAVETPAGSNDYTNQVLATSAFDDGTVLFEDLSDDGNDPDPNDDGDPNSNPAACEADPNDPDCEDTPTTVTLPPAGSAQVIGIAKQLEGLRQVRGSIYDLDFLLTVESFGPADATNVQVVDDLAATFPGVASIAIVGTPDIGGLTAPETAFNGTLDTALLAGTDTLAAGAVETIAFTARVDLGAATGPFANSATVTSAAVPGGDPIYSDLSDDGTDPDPNDGNGGDPDGDPSSNPAACDPDPNDPDCEDTPTPIVVAPQVVGVAKRAAAIRTVAPNSYEIDYVLVVENLGAVAATNVQVTEDLAAAFPGVVGLAVVGSPDIGALTPPDTAFDGVGNNALLAGTDTLAAGAVETIAYTVAVETPAGSNDYSNQVTVTSADAPGGNVLFSDLSDDGTDPDPNDGAGADPDGDPSSNPDACDPDPLNPDCEDTPTTVTLPPADAMQVIGVAKQAAAIRTVGTDRYEIDYVLVVENLGNVPATNVQVSEDLAAAFPGVIGLALVGTPDVGGLTPPAVAFDGVGNNLLLAGTDALPVGALETIAYTVAVETPAGSNDYSNQVIVTSSNEPGGNALFSDLSDDGSDPDPNDGAGGDPDGDPSSNPAACDPDPNNPDCEDTPTTVTLPPAGTAQVIGIAKALTDLRQVRGTIYDFDFLLTVESFGPADATHIQVTDDLAATFPGVASIAIVGAPDLGGLTGPDVAYDGVANTALLAGSDTLAVGAVETIVFTARVDLGDATGPFENSATVTAALEAGGDPIYTDLSDNGTDPDPNDGAGGDPDGNPSSNPGACDPDPNDPDCEDTPTPLVIDPQVIGIAKALTATRQIEGSVYEVDFSLFVENFGSVEATNVQVSDDLAAAFPGVTTIEIVGVPDVGGLTAAPTPFDGVANTALLAGSDNLPVDGTATIAFTARVDIGTAPGPFANTAVVTVSDTPGGTVLYTDLSDDGTDPDTTDGEGGPPDDDPSSNPEVCESDPNDPDCEDTPTNILLAPQVVGVAKRAAEIRTVGVNRYEIDYVLVVENLGSVIATNVQVSEDLAAAFPAVVSLALVGTPDIGGLTSPAVAFDGVGNNLLLAGTDALAVGAIETIAYTVAVETPAGSNDYTNQVTVTSSNEPGGNALFSDLSDDGTDPDPNDGAGGDPDGDPSSNPAACDPDPLNADCEDTPTTVTLPPAGDAQVIGIAKSLTGFRQVRGTIYDFDFLLTVESFGPADATNVQVVDDLAATFPGVTSVAIEGTPDLGGLSGPDVAYDGVANTALLAGTDTVAVGSVQTIEFTARVDLGDATGPFANSATVTSALTPGGDPIYSDLSDNGTDPDPNDGAGGDPDGNPSSNPGACDPDPNDPACEDTPTPIAVSAQVVGVAKQAAAVRTVGLNRYEIDYVLLLENLGSVVATNVQVSEDLAAAFPGVVGLALVGTPAIGDLTEPAVAFDGVGNNLLLAGSDSLAVGAVATIGYTVAVETPDGTNDYTNQVTVTSSGEPGGTVLFSDLSDDGDDPDPSGDGDPNSNPAACQADPNDPDCEDTPTTVTLPPAGDVQVIGIAKALTALRQVRGTIYDFDFLLTVESFGPADATNVQVVDDLAATFPGVASIAILNPPDIGGLTAPAIAYNGTTDTMLLAGTDSLAAGAVETIVFTARVDLGSATGPFENSATVTSALEPGGDPIYSDLSDNGTDPDPNDGAGGDPDGNPSSNPGACVPDPTDPDCEDTPTPISIAPQVIGIAKQLTATRMVDADAYEVDFALVVENLGPVVATNVQVTDDLAAAFPGVASIAIVGTPDVGTFTPSAVAFDGVSQLALLEGGDDLDPGEVRNISFTARIELGSAIGPFANQAVVTVSEAPGGSVLYTDLSDDGTDPDPNDGNGGDPDGDPSSNPGACDPDPTDPNCEDTPTAIVLATPSIGLAKAASAVGFDVTLDFTVENFGDVPLSDVRISDDLDEAFGAGNYTVTSAPEIVSDPGGGLVVNPLFDGTTDTELLLVGSTLAPADVAVVRIGVQLATPGSYLNVAQALGTTPGGAEVTDDSTNGDDPDNDATGPDGTTPDGGTGPNDDNGDPSDNSEPTPIAVMQGGALVSLAKAADRKVAESGGFVGYTLTLANMSGAPLPGVSIVDALPVGLDYAPNSAQLVRAGADGQLGTTDDVVTPIAASGIRPVEFGPLDLAGDETVEVTYVALVGAAAIPGSFINVAVPTLGGFPIGPEATAEVIVEGDVIFDRTTVIGTIFHDADGNGSRDAGEPGLAGVRLATVGGLLIETDRYGRYHIADVDGGRFDRGGNFILKIDPATLPAGTEFISENPRVLRLTTGLMSQIDFAVKLPPNALGGGSEEVEVSETIRFDPDSDRPASPYDRELLTDLAERLGAADEIRIKITGFTETKFPPQGEAETAERTDYFRLIPRFPILSAELQPDARAELDRIVAEWQDATRVKIDVEGHTSSLRIAPRSRHIYADNYELSQARAKAVADYLSARLAVKRGDISIIGFGPDRPVATNDTAEGRASNRRTELEMTGTFPVERRQDVPTPEGEGYDKDADRELGLRRAEAADRALGNPEGVTTESKGGTLPPGGGPRDRRAEISGSYRVALPDGGMLTIREDPAMPVPALNVGAPGSAAVSDGRLTTPIPFVIWSNYRAFYDRWEITIWRASDLERAFPLARLAGDADELRTVWKGNGVSGLEPDEELVYTLRVFDASGRFDETRPATIALVDARTKAARTLAADIAAWEGDELWGTDRLASRTIVTGGSRVRFDGVLTDPGVGLTIDGTRVPVDAEGHFATEQVLPIGSHPVEVALDNGWSESYPVDVTGEYFFMVGIADLTFGENERVDIEPLASDDRYDGDIYTDGRVAFYLKGKVKGRYLITAQLDTTEDDLDEIFDSIDEEDPRRIFRNLDPDRYYPVYGDDSTTIADVDTQGRFYVRVDWDRSQALWGNFNTSFTGTEFARFDRSLYGAMLDYQSRSITEYGDSKQQLDVFGSQAQSVFAHDEFRATGGSLYYLRETEIVQGSEKLWIEVRDRDSERVVELTPLVRGRDYEIDEIQGRILLARPLTQIAVQARPNLIQDDPLDGNDVFLAADYEFVPSGFNADDWSYGARGKLWATDAVAVGGTYVTENRNAQDYELLGGDVTVRLGESSYIKGEWSETEAAQAASGLISADGGLTFSPINTTGLTGPREGTAQGVEARINLSDFGDADGTLAAWWRDRDAGFSTARLDTGIETTEYGVEGTWQNDAGLRISGRGAVVDRDQVRKDEAYSVQADYDAGKIDVAGELRHVVESTPTSEEDADLAAVKVGVDVNDRTNVYGIAQATIDNSAGYRENDRYTVGVKSRVNDKLGLRAEASDGDRGEGALAGVDYQVSESVRVNVTGTSGGVGDAVQAGADWRINENQTLYGTYTLSTDRTDTERGAATVGQRGRISDQIEVFSEGQFIHGDRHAGLAQVYGLNFRATEELSVGASIQRSDLDDVNLGDINRDAIATWLTYRKGRGSISSKLEYRDDRGPVDQTQWLAANRADFKVNPSWTLLAKLNASESDPSASSIAAAKFIEGAVGFAYRPAEHGNWNVLGKYTYLFDLPSAGQRTVRTDQKAQLLSVEAIRNIGQRWKIGAKLAAKEAEIRLDRDSGDWIENDLQLAILRLRYHLYREWDAMAEYRMLWSDESYDDRAGYLLGVYRHLGNHAKLGIGYNFTEIDDDLTNVKTDSGGWFVNAIGKF